MIDAEPGCDVHSHELLTEKLHRVRHRLEDAIFRPTRATMRRGVPHVRILRRRDGQQAAVGAHERLERVRLEQQELQEDIRAAVRYEGVSLHLSKAQPAHVGAPLQRLPREDLTRPSRPGMELVDDHVLEALVIHRSVKAEHRHVLTGLPVDHHAIALALQTDIFKGVADHLRCDVPERSAVADLGLVAAQDGEELFDHLSHGHPGRDCVGIDDDVRPHAGARAVRQLLLVAEVATDALLAVARRKLRRGEGPHARSAAGVAR